MSDRFTRIELDTPDIDTNVFQSEGGLQVTEGNKARQINGVWHNAIGLQSTAVHRHVAKSWQDQCASFDSVLTSLERHSHTKHDIMLLESDVAVTDDPVFPSIVTLNGQLNPTPFTDNGFSSLRMFTDIPQSMISWLSEKGYHKDVVRYVNNSLTDRVEAWNASHTEPREFRLRLRHDKDGNEVVRAVCSERYGVIDNYDAMGLVRDCLQDIGQLNNVLISHLDDDGDDIFCNFLLPDEMKSYPDSDYGVGIAFRNSEIRNATLKISPFLFRAICLNGQIWGRHNGGISINKRHLGKIELDDIRADIKQSILVAITGGHAMANMMQQSQTIGIDEPLRVIAQLSRDNKLTCDQGRAWHKGYLDSKSESTGQYNDHTAFGIINGLTRSAQKYSGAMRENMEMIAGSILAPSIEADLSAISKRWGRIMSNANALDEDTVKQYQYISR